MPASLKKKKNLLGNYSRLVFCDEKLNPDIISAILKIKPTFKQKIGEKATYPWNNQKYISNVGTWKLKFPYEQMNLSCEEQIAKWLQFLKSKKNKLSKLFALGYTPYLDCPAQSADLSLYLEPSILLKLSSFKIGLSIWLHEPAKWQK